MYLGIDLGTSEIRAILVDGDQRIVDQAKAPLTASRPKPLWSEQDPEEWWLAADAVVRDLRSRRAGELAAVAGIGLSGQMHGVTLLDADGRVLRPAILGDDGRSAAECAELERREPKLRRITGNLALPGMAAPKLLWLAKHEPEVFSRIDKVLPPKDYLRRRMTGRSATDLSDGAATLWLDVGGRRWSEPMLAACSLPLSAMPELFEGTAPTGTLLPEVAQAWGVPQSAVVAGGASDWAAAAAAAGVVLPGSAFLSLDTSGVLFAATAGFSPNPDQAVQTYCHCFSNTWHQTAVILCARSCLGWVTQLTGGTNEAALLAEAGQADRDTGKLLFLPYLSGEVTPHNDPSALGVFFGLTHATKRADLVRAVLEGVAFALADGQAALRATGTEIGPITVIGSGARSPFWGRILASVLNRPLQYTQVSTTTALGAARLGRLAATWEDPVAVCGRVAIDHVVQPRADLVERYAGKIQSYRALYQTLRPAFAAPAQNGQKPNGQKK